MNCIEPSTLDASPSARLKLIWQLHVCQGIAPLLPPKPDAAPLPDGAADGIAENGDAATDAQIAERQRAAEMVALVCAASFLQSAAARVPWH